MNDAMQAKAFDGIKNTFDESYKEFCKNRGLQDEPMSRACFYAVMENVILDDPIPEEGLQIRLERYLGKAKDDALEDLREEVEALFIEMSNRKLQG